MEDVIIVFIVFSFAAFLCGGIYKLIKAKIDKTDIDEDTFDRLAKAFVEYKKDTNQRIQNLEAIIADDTISSTASSPNNQIEASKQAIEIEVQQESSKERNARRGLTNDLNHKQRTQ